MTTLDTVVLVVGPLCLLTYWIWEKRRFAKTIIVEEYKIEPSETEGFQKVILRFQDAKNRIYRFELHPAQAHYFSDELLRSTARAIAPKES